MTFPSTPINGQQAIVNNVAYQYSSASNSWTKLGTLANVLLANAAVIKGNLAASSVEVSGNVLVSSSVNVLGKMYIADVGSVSSNIGGFQTYANAQIGSISSQISGINSSTNSFYTYANSKIGTNSNSGVVTSAVYSTNGVFWSGNGAPIGEDYIKGIPSSLGNSVLRFDGVTGKLVKSSDVSIFDDGSMVISANSASAGLRITQVGTGNALVIEDSTSSDGSPIVVDANGNLGVGLAEVPFKFMVADAGITMAFAPVTGLGYFGTVTNHPILFVTNSIERLRVDTTGSILGQDNILTKVMLQDTGWDWHDSGTTNTLDYINGSAQRWAPNTGAQTLSITNWPPSGNLGEMLIEGVNLGTSTITWPTINWIQPSGAVTTSIGTYLTAISRTLQSSGTDWVLLWTRDAGTTIYGKIL